MSNIHSFQQPGIAQILNQSMFHQKTTVRYCNVAIVLTLSQHTKWDDDDCKSGSPHFGIILDTTIVLDLQISLIVYKVHYYEKLRI